MSRIMKILMVLAVAAGLSACATMQKISSSPPQQYAQKSDKVLFGTVGVVYSGDTFVVEIKDVVEGRDGDKKVMEGKSVTVRLYGIDAPVYDEAGPARLNQPFGQEARDHLVAVTKGKTVRVEALGVDKDLQAVSLVYVKNDDGSERSLNELMIYDGYAWVNDFCHESFCERWRYGLQGGGPGSDTAMAHRVGLWSKIGVEGEAPAAPAWWRKKNDAWPRRYLGAAAGVAEVVIFLTRPF